jgi:hypothetical protein
MIDTAKKIPKPYSKEWERLADDMARDFAPVIYPCKKCGYPVVKGYCCDGCGDTRPSLEE